MALVQNELPKYLLAPEVSALLHYVPDLHRKLLLATLSNTGARINEALALTRSDFSLVPPWPFVQLATLKQRSEKAARTASRAPAGNPTQPVTGAVIDSVMSRQLDDLEPLLRLHGYKMKDIVEQFGETPAEIRALFSHQLEAIRTTEIREKILALGLPI